MSVSERTRRVVSGILLLDKPAGISSNGALQVVRRAFNAIKAGHTGSLDVAASGLLPICLGEATKVCAYLLAANKRYHAEVHLGQTTTTGDREGEIISDSSSIPSSLVEIERALDDFKGSITQVPPMYSALKRGGQPLYKLARRGLEVEREARPVQIFKLQLVHFNGCRLGLDIECSKGTYIRSLAISLGERLGCGAHLSALRRIAAGPFELTRAYPLEYFKAPRQAGEEYDELLLPLDLALHELPRVDVAPHDEIAIKCGRSIQLGSASSSIGAVRIYGGDQKFVGVGLLDADGTLSPQRLMAANTPTKPPESK